MEDLKMYKVSVTKLVPLSKEEKEDMEKNRRFSNGVERNGIYYGEFKEFPVMEVALSEKEFQAIKKNVVETIA